ncbi:hypothetical protein [Deinococcus sp. Leaf326]|uniref:hypothetical protein n=1 Tax=Deinococcus sp. Leaf326 TaxID=1736338 RepID=UPI0006FEC63C|nr:hypothetical protein [Deinococcus sp. Leaf326]KQR37756.1 hypothetical protein ASF71_14845 [Deinococcus sp. Leaf326]
MPHLPEYKFIPSHLATKTKLRERGLVPTADPVAEYAFRCPDAGWRRAPLYDLKDTRNAKDAEAARKRRLANIHGQYSLFSETP